MVLSDLGGTDICCGGWWVSKKAEVSLSEWALWESEELNVFLKLAKTFFPYGI